MAEALGEVDYALGFAWWFAGEAERIRGSISQPSVSNRRTLVIKQPIGVSVALVPMEFPHCHDYTKGGGCAGGRLLYDHQTITRDSAEHVGFV